MDKTTRQIQYSVSVWYESNPHSDFVADTARTWNAQTAWQEYLRALDTEHADEWDNNANETRWRAEWDSVCLSEGLEPFAEQLKWFNAQGWAV